MVPTLSEVLESGPAYQYSLATKLVFCREEEIRKRRKSSTYLQQACIAQYRRLCMQVPCLQGYLKMQFQDGSRSSCDRMKDLKMLCSTGRTKGQYISAFRRLHQLA